MRAHSITRWQEWKNRPVQTETKVLFKYDIDLPVKCIYFKYFTA